MNKETHNVEKGRKSFNLEEAKFPAFSAVSFNSICLGMELSGVTKWLRINLTRSSLLEVFQTGQYIPTSFPRSTWKSMIANSSLQSNCNRQGFNVKNTAGTIVARIGFIANQENDCSSPDSFVAVGSTSVLYCESNNLVRISCGNAASCEADNGDKYVPAMGYVLVQ